MEVSEEMLRALQEPENDRAWKLAAGAVLQDIREQARATNGRVRRLEYTVAVIIGVVTGAVGPELLKLAEAAL